MTARSHTRAARRQRQRKRMRTRRILRQRYRSGELGAEDYRHRLALLAGTEPQGDSR